MRDDNRDHLKDGLVDTRFSSEFKQFHVVEHRHDGGMIYEIGHRHRVLGSFDTYDEAQKLLQAAVSNIQPSRELHDFILVGQLKDHPLQLDYEGFPDIGTGVAFMTVTTFYNFQTKAHDFEWHYLVHPEHDGPSKKILNTTVMNNENYEYLKDQLTMTGFSGVVEQLKDQMQQGETGFQLTHQAKYGEKEMSYTLNFRQSSKSDLYFFNSYSASLSGGKNDLSTTFYADQRITAKEAFNLLDGRSVEKKYNHHEKIGEGDNAVYRPIKDSTYNQWVKLDLNDVDKNGNFKVLTYGEKWGFNLEEQLAKLPVRQLGNEESKAELMNSLRKGNIQSVTFEQNGVSEARYVEANPRFRTINVYDNNMEQIKDQKQARNVASGDDNTKEQKQSEKQEEKPEEDGPSKQKQSRSRKVG